jgi:hypothetical protein
MEEFETIANEWFKKHHVKKIKYVNGLYGRAFCELDEIVIPKPTTAMRMYIIAHELGHLALHYKCKKRQFIKEYEAEIYAYNLMKKYKIDIPRKSILRAKKYVIYRIRLSLKRGLKESVPKEIMQWLKS